jgi:hypothetical protein
LVKWDSGIRKCGFWVEKGFYGDKKGPARGFLGSLGKFEIRLGDLIWGALGV